MEPPCGILQQHGEGLLIQHLAGVAGSDPGGEKIDARDFRALAGGGIPRALAGEVVRQSGGGALPEEDTIQGRVPQIGINEQGAVVLLW